MTTKAIIFLLTSLAATTTHAASCWPLYEAEQKKIDEEGAYSVYVGGQFYQVGGQLSYDPGIKMAGYVENWARDLLESIKWGPSTQMYQRKNHRKEWLETLQDSIDKNCKIKGEEFEDLRSMLKVLMEDGSFCPDNQILKPGFFGGKGSFKKALKAALKEHKFTEFCQKEAIQDDSDRQIKEIPHSGKKSKTNNQASEQ